MPAPILYVPRLTLSRCLQSMQNEHGTEEDIEALFTDPARSFIALLHNSLLEQMLRSSQPSESNLDIQQVEQVLPHSYLWPVH